MNKNNYIKNKKNNSTKIMEHFDSNMQIFIRAPNNSHFIENFELLKYINSGSTGVVYEGFYRKKYKKHVCFKFIFKKFQKIKDINTHKKLKNKNIIEYYEYIDSKNEGCIIMEYAKFGDLENFKKLLNKKIFFSETLLAFITIQILNGLYFLHQSKIIHMDIKPQNILINDFLDIKITDFSVSLSYQNTNKNKNKIKLPFSGTCLYMSPEILSREFIDYEDCNKIDIFSLGVVLYNLAFDQFPYGLDYSYINHFNSILNKIKNEKLVIPDRKNYSILFKKFLFALLNKNIKKRISIYDVLEHPWIKAANLLMKEKEKIYDLEKFLINLITDNVRCFNEYIKNENNITR